MSHRGRIVAVLGVLAAGLGVAALAWAVDGAVWIGTAVSNGDGARTYAGPSAQYPVVEAFDGRTFTVTLTKQATGEGPYTITARGSFARENSHPSAEYFVFTADNAKIRNAAGEVVCKKGTVAAGGSLQLSWVFQMTFPEKCPVFPGTNFVGVDAGLSYRTDYARIWQTG
jgi:hypothetical protein